MKKIYFCMSSLGQGGITGIICNVILELRKTNFDLEYKILTSNEEIPNGFPTELIDCIIFEPKMNYNKYRFLAIIPTIRFMRKNNKSMYIYFMYLDTLVPLFINIFKFKKNKIIVRMSGNLSNTKNEIKSKDMNKLLKILYLLQNYLQNFLLSSVSSFILLCDRTKNEFKFEVKNKEFYHIENPISDTLIQKDVAIDKIDKNKISVIARIEKYKGLDELIELVPMLKNKESLIYVYGDGSYTFELQKKIEKANLQNRIILCGQEKKICEKIIESSLVLSVSLGEGMPNNLLESFALGRPVVAYDCFTGPREIINDVNGFLVELKNLNMLAEAINLASEKKWDYEKIKYEAKIRFNSQKISKDYINMIFSELK